MKLWVAGLLLMGFLAGGCKERGVATIEIDFGGLCAAIDATDDVRVYYIAGATCAACQCGGCFDTCDNDGCTLACDGLCSAADLEEAQFELGAAGLYAAIFEYSTLDSAGFRRIVGSACAEIVLDPDGTDDRTFVAETMCCVN